MSSPAFLTGPDEAARREAIDPQRSFLVHAPAGSGKTELLIQRCLRLLATVDRPEAIVAITFTKKAAAEMLGRILEALRDAADDRPIEQAHKQITRDLARGVLDRDRELGWDLLQHPGRLRIQTVDSLCLSIAGEMPWLSRLGAMPRIEEDTRVLYLEAARRTLLETGLEFDDALGQLLLHLDNNAARAQELIASMLAKRDQWLKLAYQTGHEEREFLEDALQRTIERQLNVVADLTPEYLRDIWVDLARYSAANMTNPPAGIVDILTWPPPSAEHVDIWRDLANVFLTGGGDWRKKLTSLCGFPTTNRPKKQEGESFITQLQQVDGLLDALKALRKLPPPRYSDAQWAVLHALLKTLRLAVGQLKMVFRERQVIDFCELGIAARQALGPSDQPTDLAYRLDSRIQHLLIDEFQDTSHSQFELVRQLTADWLPDDGRTLFLVGDPSQSIYRFRQAEVGLFIEVQNRGLGNVQPELRKLTVNYRSVPAIVERVNQLFSDIFPDADHIETGAVAYSPSQPHQAGTLTPQEGKGITWDIFLGDSDPKNPQQQLRGESGQQEADRVIQRIQEARAVDPQGSIAILTRARTHLPKIIAALKAAGLTYRAVEIDRLEERTIVRDLLALTRAMLHEADRISWLAILRAPWCGLTLSDLEALVGSRPNETLASSSTERSRRSIWNCLQDLSRLSPDGQTRAQRLRDIFAEAFAEKGRWPLRRWVERVWIKLGGPAVLSGGIESSPQDQPDDALEDAGAYFDLLEAEQTGLDLRDLEQFGKRVSLLYARPVAEHDDASGNGGLSVMTIHKAKGLEFDTVIVPGLDRKTPPDDMQLVLFHQWHDGDREELLLAPIDPPGAKAADAVYSYLQSLEAQKNGYERARQLYVAMTRAKKRLHLMGVVGMTQKGEVKLESGSMLKDLWPAMTAEERTIKNDHAEISGAVPRPPALRRVSSEWSLPELPAPIAWIQTSTAQDPHEPSFEWAGETLRRAGTVVHALLQRMSPGYLQVPDRRFIRASLIHAGVSSDELDFATKRVEEALLRTTTSERGRWILALHQDARAEYALAAIANGENAPGEILRGLVDRTFIDELGTRWVIDFKTSAHEGGNLKKFLEEQQRRYEDQMERYARIFAPLGNPVRLGLYFPLLDEWREWAPTTQTATARS